MLTRVAFVALSRIADGQSAFRTMLPSHRDPMFIQRRRDALSELYRLRYVIRGPRGPQITATGKAALKFHRYLADNKRPLDGPSVAAEAERLGISRRALETRIYRFRHALELRYP